MLQTLEETPPEKYLDAMEELLKSVAGVESILLSEDVYVTEIDDMKDKLDKYKVCVAADSDYYK